MSRYVYRDAASDSAPSSHSTDGERSPGRRTLVPPRSGGQAIPGELRSQLEPALGADLSGVRLHTGAESAAAAHELDAHAFAMGQDVHFGAGEYAPGSDAGDRLIAHEVAHTVQQRGAAEAPACAALEVSQPGDALEVEAAAFASSFGSDAPHRVSAGSASSVARAIIQREGKDSAPAPEAELAPAEDINDLLQQCGDSFADILAMQMMGVEDLAIALGTPDVPSLGEQLIKMAASLALTTATGGIVKFLANAIAPEIAFLVESANKAAHKVTVAKVAGIATTALNSFGGAMSLILSDVANSGAGVVGLPAHHQFIQSQKTALIAGKRRAQQTFTKEKQNFRSPEGAIAAKALWRTLDSQFARAQTEQLLASLSQWSEIVRRNAGGGSEAGIMVLEVVLTGPRTFAIKNASWAGINDQTRAMARGTFSGRPLRDLNQSVRLEITTADWEFLGIDDAEFVVSQVAGRELDFPKSGEGAYCLHAISAAYSGLPANPGVGIEPARAAASILMDRALNTTIGSLGKIDD